MSTKNEPQNKSTQSSTISKRAKGISQWSIAWRRFKKNRAALAGLILVGVVIVMAVFSPIIARYPPNALPGFSTGQTRAPPSLAYLFGTDLIGHDVFSQVV